MEPGIGFWGRKGNLRKGVATPIKTAREDAALGARAGCEFDKNSGWPIEAFSPKSKA